MDISQSVGRDSASKQAGIQRTVPREGVNRKCANNRIDESQRSSKKPNQSNQNELCELEGNYTRKAKCSSSFDPLKRMGSSKRTPPKRSPFKDKLSNSNRKLSPQIGHHHCYQRKSHSTVRYSNTNNNAGGKGCDLKNQKSKEIENKVQTASEYLQNMFRYMK